MISYTVSSQAVPSNRLSLHVLQSLRLAQREARALRLCNHPCIIKLLDCFRSPSGRAYLVRGVHLASWAPGV